MGERDCDACDGTGEVEDDTDDNESEWDRSNSNPDNWDEDMYGSRADDDR